MILIAVDDEPLALRDLAQTLAEALPEAEIHSFSTPARALQFAIESVMPVDVAFLDIEMGGVNGLELAKMLKDISGQTNIVFVTGYSEYALEAFSLYASGYLLKPVKAQSVLQVMENLRQPVDVLHSAKLRVRTFGNFEVFSKNKPVHFARSKAKELFAYLVHRRGTSCTMKELAAVLFEDREYNVSLQKQMQTIVSSMMKTLADEDAQNAVVKQFNSLAVDPSKLNCDYYRFLCWDPLVVGAYTGEYMANYAWAEETSAYLDRRIREKFSF